VSEEDGMAKGLWDRIDGGSYCVHKDSNLAGYCRGRHSGFHLHLPSFRRRPESRRGPVPPGSERGIISEEGGMRGIVQPSRVTWSVVCSVSWIPAFAGMTGTKLGGATATYRLSGDVDDSLQGSSPETGKTLLSIFSLRPRTWNMKPFFSGDDYDG